MDSFWDKIKDFNFDLKWLSKVKNHLKKLAGNKTQKIKKSFKIC